MPTVIAVDGPSGSGKSSTARGVAQKLGYAYLDTGAMYRAMTWALLERGIDLDDPEAIGEAAPDVVIISGTDAAHPTIAADGSDVSEPIRGERVTAHVSQVAAVPLVRELMVAQQRSIIAGSGSAGGIVVEGRDIGTTVAPDADVKVYLIADPEARAQRRALEAGGADEAATLESLARRDRIDSARAASPLAKSDDAVEIDGTYLTLDEVIALILAMVEQR